MGKYDIEDNLKTINGIYIPGELIKNFEILAGSDSIEEQEEKQKKGKSSGKRLFNTAGTAFQFLTAYGVKNEAAYEVFSKRKTKKIESKEYKNEVIRIGTTGKEVTNNLTKIVFTSAFHYYKTVSKEIKTFEEIFTKEYSDIFHVAERYCAGGLNYFFYDNPDYNVEDPMPTKVKKIYQDLYKD